MDGVPIESQGNQAPQRFSTPNNALISVGSVNARGEKSGFNLPPGPPSGADVFVGNSQHLTGSISIYVLAEHIKVANVDPARRRLGQTRYDQGTSIAAPQIAGLAAYFLGLPGQTRFSNVRSLSMDMKNYLVRAARDSRHDGAGVANNDVGTLMCTPTTKKARSIEEVAINGTAEDLTDLLLAATKLQDLSLGES